MSMIEFNAAVFAFFKLVLLFFGQLSRAMENYQLEWGGMPLHDAVGVNCTKGATTENQAQVPGA